MRRGFGRSALRLAGFAASLLLAGCWQPATLPEAGAPAVIEAGVPPDPLRSRIVFTALQMVGVPYRYGGQSPQGFDCSGLVQYAYRSAGLAVPRTSREQLRASTPVSLDGAAAGDLVFFQGTDLSHVGIYLGEGRFVHAPATGQVVSIGSFDEPYYRQHFVRAGRMPAVTAAAATCSEDC